MDAAFYLSWLKAEIEAAWVVASTFERFIVIISAFTVPYDVWLGNWFDLIVAAAAITWVWYSIRSNIGPGDL
jgi:hypothetical protein